MKKRTEVLLLVTILVVCLLTGCAKKTAVIGANAEDGKLKVVAVNYAAYDFARAVAGEQADITMLLQPGAEAHSYEPTPQDIITIQKSSVLIYTGGESDVWVDEVLKSVNMDNIAIVRMIDCVTPYEEELVEGMQEVDHEHAEDGETQEDHEHVEDGETQEDHEHVEDGETQEDHEHIQEAEWDEHVWTSPINAAKISRVLADTFAQKDSENADLYQRNFTEYEGKLNELDQAFCAVTANASDNLIVFGDRFPLRYFVEEYGISYRAAFPGCASDAEPSAATIAYLIDLVKENEIPVVFKIELSNGKVAQAIADATGAKVETFYACHNVTRDDFSKGVTYLDYMWKNVDVLKEALK